MVRNFFAMFVFIFMLYGGLNQMILSEFDFTVFFVWASLYEMSVL